MLKNNVTFYGRITQTVKVIKVGANDTSMARIGVAVNEWNPRDKKESTTFVDGVAWGEKADRLDGTPQGTFVICEGKMRNRKLEVDGKSISTINVWLDYVDIPIKPKKEPAPKQEVPEEDIPEDVPF